MTGSPFPTTLRIYVRHAPRAIYGPVIFQKRWESHVNVEDPTRPYTVWIGPDCYTHLGAYLRAWLWIRKNREVALP